MLRRVMCLAAIAVLWSCSLGDEDFVGTWTNPEGQPASSGKYGNERYELQVFRGAEHCGWTSVTFLLMAWPPGTVAVPTAEGVPVEERTYVRDRGQVIGGVAYEGSLDLDAELPVGSRPTGYEHGDTELWFGPDKGERFAYLKEVETTERWPRALKPPACA